MNAPCFLPAGIFRENRPFLLRRAVVQYNMIATWGGEIFPFSGVFWK